MCGTNRYSERQKADIAIRIYQTVKARIDMCSSDEEVDEVAASYGVTFEEDSPPVRKESKILILGVLAGKQKDYVMAAKKLGIPEYCLEFEGDYRKLKHYDTARLEYNSAYSDIIFGPMPHSMAGIEGASSFIAKVKNDPSRYPRAHVCDSGGSLKITISTFKDAISKSRYCEKMDL